MRSWRSARWVMHSMGEWIGTVGAVVASLTAIWGVWQWRRQMIAGRRMQIAEEVLSAFYEAQDIIRAARSPLSIGDEGRTWRGDEQAQDQRPELRRADGYFAPAERLFKEKEFFAKLRALQYRFQAVFGPQTGQHFLTVWKVRNRIIISSETLAHTAFESIEGRDPIDQELRKSWEADIWWRNQDDNISVTMDTVVQEMEEICRPELTKWLSP